MRFRRVIKYIQEHLGGDLTCGKLAEIAGLPPHQFARLFKISTGMLPYRLVLHQRIARAGVLLANLTLPIPEICSAVGFGNESHFRRHFRRITGKTPEQFRVDTWNP